MKTNKNKKSAAGVKFTFVPSTQTVNPRLFLMFIDCPRDELRHLV
jgi:hypothetical protein